MSNESVDQVVALAQLDHPKSSAGIVQLPCGYLAPDGVLHTEVAIREISGAEEDMLASKVIPDGKKFNELVTRCITRIGTITSPSEIATACQTLLPGDSVFLLFAIRRVSVGDLYPFRVKCPDCDKSGMHTIDLSELETRKMPNPLKRAGYDVTLPSGHTARLRCVSVTEGERLLGAMTQGKNKIKKSEEAITLGMLTRVEQLDGQPPSLSALQALGLKDRNFIRESFDKIDGGIETSVDFQCAFCDSEFQKDVDVGQKGFFSPSRELKN